MRKLSNPPTGVPSRTRVVKGTTGAGHPACGLPLVKVFTVKVFMQDMEAAEMALVLSNL